MTFIALALQVEKDLRDALRDYWSRLSTAAHSVLWWDYDMKQISTHTLFFCILWTIHRDQTKVTNMTDYGN